MLLVSDFSQIKSVSIYEMLLIVNVAILLVSVAGAISKFEDT